MNDEPGESVTSQTPTPEVATTNSNGVQQQTTTTTNSNKVRQQTTSRSDNKQQQGPTTGTNLSSELAVADEIDRGTGIGSHFHLDRRALGEGERAEGETPRRHRRHHDALERGMHDRPAVGERVPGGPGGRRQNDAVRLAVGQQLPVEVNVQVGQVRRRTAVDLAGKR